MAAQVPNIFVEQYDQGQKKIRADLMDENFAYVCTQLDANADTGSAAASAAAAAQSAADAAQSAADAAQTTADGKANADLDDVTAAGKTVMAHAAMPSEQYIDYSVNYGANDNVWGYTDITAPADGWIYLYASAGSTRANTNIDISVRGTNNEFIYGCSLDKPSTNSTGSGIAVFVPIKAGALARIAVRAIASDSSHLPVLRFIYANGSAPTN